MFYELQTCYTKCGVKKMSYNFFFTKLHEITNDLIYCLN